VLTGTVCDSASLGIQDRKYCRAVLILRLEPTEGRVAIRRIRSLYALEHQLMHNAQMNSAE
jgi:hypothetical protein